jgi:SAM-dependent methyltransferase
MKNYQLNYSRINTSLFDRDIRKIKAEKIVKIVEDFSQKDLSRCRGLEIGCSTGQNINFLSTKFDECIGIDIDQDAVRFGYSNKKSNVNFFLGDAMQLPFRSDEFDVILCNHVYEHVPDSELLMKEVYRVLKHDGFCYFAAGNKFSLMEGHYHLPFLSWIPKKFANLYLRLLQRGTEYYENHLSLSGIRMLTKDFSVTDYTLKVITEPERFGAEDMISSNSIIRKIPKYVIKLLMPLIPTYIFILTKPQHEKGNNMEFPIKKV